MANNCTRTTAGCDMFEFMSKHVGLTVLHPGGLDATNQLTEALGIDRQSVVLDIACGKGTTSVQMARRYGCQVTGIDICASSIEEARELSRRHRVDHLTTFEVADATRLPYANNSFDVTIAQAMLVLIEDRRQVIEEMVRVLKPNGRSGWLELTWKEEPPPEFVARASRDICAFCIDNVRTDRGWSELFEQARVGRLEVKTFTMEARGMLGMLSDEGVVNAFVVLHRYLADQKIRKRMKNLARLLTANSRYFGYGFYIASESL